MSQGEASTTERGVSATPIKTFVFADAPPFAKHLDVLPGRTYELRTNAQTITEFEGGGGVVTYPLCYVGDGGSAGQGLKPQQGTPFSRMREVRITPKNRQLLISAEVNCIVWVCVVDDGQHLANDGQGCGCSSSVPCGCSGKGPLPSSTRKKPCGCTGGF